MNGYSKDLRLCGCCCGRPQHATKEAVEAVGMSLPTIKRWPKRRRQMGDVEVKPVLGKPWVKGAALIGRGCCPDGFGSIPT